MLDDLAIADALRRREVIDVLRHRVGVATGSRQRRREPRYQAVEDRLWVQWWDGGEHLGRSARLVNVSRHGAMVVAPVLFRPTQEVRVFLEEPAPQVGAAAVVRGVVEGLQGLHQVHLEFVSGCPDAFFEAATSAAANGFESWLSGSRSRL